TTTIPGAAIPTKRTNATERFWSWANEALSVIGASDVLRPPTLREARRSAYSPDRQVQDCWCEEAAGPAISIRSWTKDDRARQVDRRASWNRIYWPGTIVKVADTVWRAKLGVIRKTKKGETPCLFKSTKTLQQ